jgi:hypothetical protein
MHPTLARRSLHPIARCRDAGKLQSTAAAISPALLALVVHLADGIDDEPRLIESCRLPFHPVGRSGCIG